MCNVRTTIKRLLLQRERPTSRCDQTVRRTHIISPELRLGEVNLGVMKLDKVMSG